jgi:uncharacterized membrane protein
MKQIENEIRKEFQLERIIFFSDAVFAIAITLLIIDVHIPYQEGLTNRDLMEAVGNEIPALIGFFVSFFFIGTYWVIHHKMFGYVHRFDNRLIWINLFFLLSIVLLPFTTGIFGMYGNLSAAFCLYVGNAIFTGVMNFFCWKHILNPSRKLTLTTYDKSFRRAAYTRSLIMPSWFFICGIIAILINVYVGEMMIPVISLLYFINGKMSKRK